MSMRTELGRVRGLGSAKSGTQHWWQLRVTSAGTLVLDFWLIFSLFRLPSLDYNSVAGWLSSPLAAVPLALLVINWCWHLRLGLMEPIEDYVHGGSRILTLGLLHLWTYGVGGFALFSILKVAFTGAPA